MAVVGSGRQWSGISFLSLSFFLHPFWLAITPLLPLPTTARRTVAVVADGARKEVMPGATS
jgi:hypothetical protein